MSSLINARNAAKVLSANNNKGTVQEVRQRSLQGGRDQIKKSSPGSTLGVHVTNTMHVFFFR